jgi:hypothetical protein
MLNDIPLFSTIIEDIGVDKLCRYLSYSVIGSVSCEEYDSGNITE